MCQFIQDNWREVLGFVIAGAGLWKYMDSRKRELAWQRTEFLFKQTRLLDTDPDLRDAVLVLEGRHPSFTLDALFDNYTPPGKPEHAEMHQKIDALLNFIDCVAYSQRKAKTLSASEVTHFGWYAKQVSGHAGLKSYCQQYYKDVLEFETHLK